MNLLEKRGIAMNFINMKKIFLLFAFILFSENIFSLSFGFESEANVLKMPESEYLDDFAFSSDFSVFASEKFSFGNYFLSLKPSVHFSGNKINFQFAELKNSFLFDYFAFSFGKYNFYFGKPQVKNNFFPSVPLENLSEKNLWNGKLDLFLGNFRVNGGAVFDTESLDSFEKPEWWNAYFSAFYSNQFLEAGLESDFLFASENLKDSGAAEISSSLENVKAKAAAEISFFFSDFVLYGDFSVSDSDYGFPPFSDFQNFDFSALDFSALCGISWNKYLEDFGFSLIFENGFLEDNYCYSFCFLPEFSSLFSFYLKYEHILNTRLDFLGNFSVFLKDFKVYFEYQSRNFIKDDSRCRITVGVKNEF